MASHCPNTRHFVGRETNTDPRAKNKPTRLWVYARDETPWASGAPPAVWYQFSTSRGAEHPSLHLATYEGFAHAGAYAGYNDAYRTGRIKEMVCPLGSMLRMRLSGNILSLIHI